MRIRCGTILAAAVLSSCAFGAIDGFDADGLPFAEKGFGVRRNFYQSGRISVKASDISGPFAVYYIGKQPHTKGLFYSAAEQCTWSRFMAPQVMIGENRYRLTFSNTTHYPFGFTSECTLEGVKFRHAMVLDGNVIFRRVTVVDNPERMPVRAVCVQMDTLKGLHFKIDHERRALVGSRTDEGEETSVEIGSMNAVDFPLNDRPKKPLAFNKPWDDGTLSLRYDMVETSPSDDHLFWCVFSRRADEDLSPKRVERVFADFAARHVRDARFSTGDSAVDGALDFVAPMSAAFEVDGAGAFRASPTYWVWGWDAMVHAGSLALVGRAEEIKRMLDFFHCVADPQEGILHSYKTTFAFDGDAGSTAPGAAFTLSPAVQLLYVILLNDYFNATGDAATKAKHLAFCRQLVERAKAAAKPGETLVRGYGFFPDNPFAVDQQLDDFSLINNAIYYQGLCAWEELSGAGAEKSESVRKAIDDMFYDPAVGWWCDAADAQTGVKRPHYPLYGLFTVSPFAEAGALPLPKTAEWLKTNFLRGDRLCMFPKGSASDRADGNQLGAYYPVTDRTYWRVMNAAGRLDALTDYRRIVGSHWKTLTYPEGQSADVLNGNPADYSDELGTKQFFTAKGWLADALDLWLGLRVSKDGLSFHPMNDGKPFAVRGLSLQGRTLDVEMTGTGTEASYSLNGNALDDGFVPWNRLKPGSNIVKITMRGTK